MQAAIMDPPTRSRRLLRFAAQTKNLAIGTRVVRQPYPPLCMGARMKASVSESICVGLCTAAPALTDIKHISSSYEG